MTPEKPTLEQEVIGMEKPVAIAKIEDVKQIARVVAEDGESFPVTMELRGDRVNLEIVEGKVIGAYRG